MRRLMLRRCASAARFALFPLAALAGAATMWSGCGSDTPSNPSSGDPVDAALFVALPPPCAQALQLCTEEFIYPYNGESSVEFMGNFRPNGWVRRSLLLAGLHRLAGLRRSPVGAGRLVQVSRQWHDVGERPRERER